MIDRKRLIFISDILIYSKSLKFDFYTLALDFFLSIFNQLDI